jgi:hypothetical protein
MKKLVHLGLVLALLAVASPAISGPRPILQYCWNVEGTSCPGPGQTTSCTDACSYLYTCSCINWGGHYVWDCPEVC